MPLFSRPKQRADIRYAYGSTIDMQGGFVAMPYSVKGDAGKAYGAASVFETYRVEDNLKIYVFDAQTSTQ